MSDQNDNGTETVEIRCVHCGELHEFIAPKFKHGVRVIYAGGKCEHDGAAKEGG